MKVILLQDVKKLGKKGEIIEVSEGYGRNFLLPRKLAAPGTSENINDAKQKQAAAKHKAQVASDEAVVLASQLKKVELTIPVKVGEGGKVFGAITGKISAKRRRLSTTSTSTKRKSKSRTRLNRWERTTSSSACIRPLRASSRFMS